MGIDFKVKVDNLKLELKKLGNGRIDPANFSTAFKKVFPTDAELSQMDMADLVSYKASTDSLKQIPGLNYSQVRQLKVNLTSTISSKLPDGPVKNALDTWTINNDLDVNWKQARSRQFNEAGVPEWASDMAKTGVKAGLVFGGVNWIEDKFLENDKLQKQCMGFCLPYNWDSSELSGYGNLPTSELEYQNLATVTEMHDGNLPDADGWEWSTQPFCTQQIEHCGNYCKEKCDEEHDMRIPGVSTVLDAAEEAADEAAETTSDILKNLFDGLGLGNIGTVFKYLILGVFVFLVFILITKISSS